MRYFDNNLESVSIFIAAFFDAFTLTRPNGTPKCGASKRGALLAGRVRDVRIRAGSAFTVYEKGSPDGGARYVWHRRLNVLIGRLFSWFHARAVLPAR